MRIRKMRNELLARIDLARATPDELQQLLAINRYESRARTRRRRASGKLQTTSVFFAKRTQFSAMRLKKEIATFVKVATEPRPIASFE
jgi:hypothetical protein